MAERRREDQANLTPRRECGAAFSSTIGARQIAAGQIAVTVNGEAVSLDENSSVADLLVRLDLASQAVAVEVNLELVPRARHGHVRLSASDRVEIVTLVGGG
ncbi:MAG: sulfur carrier protein ThiS [Pirellulales bacterium]